MVRPWLALALMCTALAARLLVPAGFMPMWGEHGIMLVPCSGHGPMAMPMAGDHSSKPMTQHDQPPCGFAPMADLGTGGADLVLLGIAIAFVMARSRIARRAVPLPSPARLRPPLRAPPA